MHTTDKTGRPVVLPPLLSATRPCYRWSTTRQV